MSKTPTFKRILITRPFQFVTNVQLNRPEKRNAFDDIFWKEIGEAFNFLATDSDTRVIILSGNGAPVIATIHKACFGGGVDIIAACDIRVAVENTLFSVKEVDIGLAADVGSLNRLPKICGNNSWIREISFTARTFDAKEALQNNLLSKIYPTQEIMKSEVEKLAQIIASKSPVAVEGTKIILNYSRDHPVQDSLQFTANWNMSQLFTDDVPKSAMASFQKKELPKFSKL
uniref:Uncharacterized protein n=1 Tax=Panagrolaimus davidi TaxID=227884 RepID=A0A914PIR9_9BILA